jgi:hypothetical protein
MRTTVLLLCELVMLVLLAGCGKKPKPDERESGGGSPVSEASTPTHSIKLGRLKPNAKRLVTQLRTTEATITLKDQRQVETTEESDEYVESILEMKDGKPIKTSRAYRYARKTTRPGSEVELVYSGKAVQIEQKDGLIKITMNGRELSATESKAIRDELSGSSSIDPESRLPKTPVRIKQEWIVDRDVIRDWARNSTGNIDAERSSIRGQLLDAYTTKDGKQWGRIEYRAEILNKSDTTDGPSQLTVIATEETPIDGSSLEGKKVQKGIAAPWSVKGSNGEDVRVSATFTDTKTIKTLAE